MVSENVTFELQLKDTSANKKSHATVASTNLSHTIVRADACNSLLLCEMCLIVMMFALWYYIT